MSIDKSLDAGMDIRSPVDDSYRLPFQFTGKINKVTLNIEREQLDQKGAGQRARLIVQISKPRHRPGLFIRRRARRGFLSGLTWIKN